MLIREMEQYLNEAGYFLRDDRPLREGDPDFAGIEEAYSLYTDNPFRRHEVFGGPRHWAVEKAYKLVFFGYRSGKHEHPALKNHSASGPEPS